MLQYRTQFGEDIRIVAAKMVVYAEAQQQNVCCYFNGVNIIAVPGNSPEKIVKQYYRKYPGGPKKQM